MLSFKSSLFQGLTTYRNMYPLLKASMMSSHASRHVNSAEDVTPTHHWSRRDWAALALLALLVALFFWQILTPNLNDRASFPPGDFSYQFWAFSTFEAESGDEGLCGYRELILQTPTSLSSAGLSHSTEMA